MNPEHADYLRKTYPKIFPNGRAGYEFGFECGDGWFNIISTLAKSIHEHVANCRHNRAEALLLSRRLKRARKLNSVLPLIEHHRDLQGGEIADWYVNYAEELLDGSSKISIPARVEPVVAHQVKEKFGELRFYYSGGDEYVSGMVDFATDMSTKTCDTCGSPGTYYRQNGWIHVACEKHGKGVKI